MSQYRYEPNGELPSHVKAALTHWPASGSGGRLVHRHVLKLTNLLRHYTHAEAASRILAERMPRRPKAGEIAEALELAYGSGPMPKPDCQPPRHRVDVRLIENIVAERFSGRSLLEELRQRSPLPIPGSTDEIVRRLFEPESLICVATRPWNALTALLSNLEELSEWELIVPSPMSNFYSVDEEGRKHARSNANTSARRFIVTDFDIKPTDKNGKPTIYFDLIKRWEKDGVSIQDAAATLIGFLQTLPGPLSMVVYSGNQSLQAWWFCEGEDESLSGGMRAFFESAVILGADPAGWTKCQLFRMPGALRSDTGRRQVVHYFDPSVIR